MSKEGNSGEVPGEGTTGSDALKKDADIYENRGTKKIVRLITVIAYMFSVSFVAIVLSGYYLFIWEAPNPRLIRRPLQFSSDPLMQSLISDRITVQGDSNTSNISFSVRNFDTDNHFNDYDHIRKHEKQLNESLLLLRNSLVEALRAKQMNDSKLSNRNVSSKNWTISEYVNYTSSEKGKMLNLTGRSVGRGLGHSDIDNDKSLTVESLAISENEANNDRFTSTRNYSDRDSFENSFQLNDNFTEKYKISVSSHSKPKPEAEKMTMPSNGTGIIMTINDKGNVDIDKNRENLTYISLNDKSSAKPTRSRYLEFAVNNQRYLENVTNGVVNFKGDERKDKLYEPKHKQKLVRVLTVVAYVIFVSMAAILLSLYYTFLWDPKDVSTKMRMPPECANIRLSNSFTTSSTVNETQMERMTGKSVTVANEQSEESRFSEIVTMQHQKDLLTTLIEIAANTSSSVTPPITFDDLETDDVETKETSTKIDSKID